MRGALYFLQLLQSSNPPIDGLERFGAWGTIMMLILLISERVVPPLAKALRPIWERKVQQADEEIQRVQTLEEREVAAWEQVAESNKQLATAVTQLSTAVARFESDQVAMRAGMATLLERTAGCEVRTHPRPRKKENPIGGGA